MKNRNSLRIIGLILTIHLLLIYSINSQDVPQIIPQIGHLNNINAMAFSPDEKILVSLDEHDIKIWDLPTGLLRKNINAEGKSYAVEFESDSSFIVLYDKGMLAKYNAYSGKNEFLAELLQPDPYMISYVSGCDIMEIIPENSTVLIIAKESGNNFSIQLRSSLDGSLLKTIQKNLEWVIGFTRIGNNIYYSDYNGTIYHYSIKDKEAIKDFDLESKAIPVRIGTIDDKITSLQDDGFIYFYTLDGKPEQKTQIIYENDYFYRRNHPIIMDTKGFYYFLQVKEIDPKYENSSIRDQLIPENIYKLLGVKNEAEAVEIRLDEDFSYLSGIDIMELSDNGNILAFSSNDNIYIINTETKKILLSFKNTIQQIKQVQFISSSELLVNTFVADSKTEIWNLERGNIKTFEHLKNDPMYIDYNKFLNTYAFSYGLEIEFLDENFIQKDKMFITDEIDYIYKDAYVIPAGNYPVKFGKDGKSILSQDGNKCGIKLWSYPEKTLITRIKADQDNQIIEHLDYNSEMQYAIVETSNNAFGNYKSRIYDLKKKKLVYEKQYNYEFGAQFIPGTNLAVVPDGIYNLDTKETIKVFSESNWLIGGQVFVNENNVYFMDGNSVDKFIPEEMKFKTVLNASGDGFSIKNNKAVIYDENGTVSIYNIESDTLIATIYSEDLPGNKSFLIYTADNYYMNTRYGLNTIAYSWNNQIYHFDQFDKIYNRPDMILEKLGFANSELIKIYKNAFQKRSISGEEYKIEDFSKLSVSISNRSEIPFVTDEKSITINYEANSSAKLIESIEMRNNGVIQERFHFDNPGLHISWTRDVELIPGNNLIEATVYDESGNSSLSSRIEVKCNKTDKNPDLYYVGIGVGNYFNDNMDLTYPVKDINDLANYFKISRFYDKKNILLLRDQSFCTDSLYVIKDFLKNASPEDILILSYSGHGLLDENGKFLLATANSSYEKLGLKGIPLNEIEKLLAESNTLKRLFFIDACHSGLLDLDEFKKNIDTIINPNIVPKAKGAGILYNIEPREDAFELMQSQFMNLDRGSGTHVIAASGGNQYAFESDKYKNGLFTYSLLRILKEGKAGNSKNDFISVNDLREELEKNVLELSDSLQKPVSRKLNYHFNFDFWSKADAEHSFFEEAIMQEDYKKLAQLIDDDFDVNCTDPQNGYTALHYASREGRYYMVNYLLKNGANINAQTKYGLTPLHLAVYNNQFNVSELLLYYKADDKIANSSGETPLNNASAKNNELMVDLLSNKEKYLDEFKLFHSIRTSDKLLLKSIVGKTNVNAIETNGTNRPLHEAAKFNMGSFIDILVENGANIDLKEKSNKYTPMDYAVYNNAYSAIVSLYHYGAEITPTATQAVNFKRAKNQLSFKMERFFNNPDSVLLSYRNVKKYLDAIEAGNLQRLDSLLTATGEDVNKILTLGNGYNLLMITLIFDDDNIAQYLIEQGIDINHIAENHYTPLILSVTLNKPLFTEMLLNYGANPNQKTDLNIDLMEYARGLGNSEIIEILNSRVEPTILHK